MTRYEIILYCQHQEHSRNFYTHLLAQDPVLDVPGMTEFQLTPEVKLGLMPEAGIAKILADKTPHPAKGSGIPRCELYIYTDQIEAMYQRALDAGATAITPIAPRDWGDRVGYLSDLDGHVIALAQKNN